MTVTETVDRPAYEQIQKQFGEVAERLDRQEYFEVVREIELQIEGKFADGMSIIPLDDKESFGDIDMVIIWDKSQEESGEDYFREIFGEKVISYTHLKNNKMDSLLLRLNSGKVAQVDFARTKNEIEFQAKMIHASMGHSSAVIGTLALANGYKFAQDGLYKRHFDKQGQSHDILITQDLLLAMEMLGFEPNKWIDAKNIDDIVDLVSSSRFFNNKYFDKETMKHKRRKAISKRSIQDYMYTRLAKCESAADCLDQESYFREKFSEYQELVEEQIALLDIKKKGVGINGDTVIEAFGIPPSKVVGEILKYIRANYPDAETISDEMRDKVQQHLGL